MLLSLLQTSQNRRKELERFVASLNAQSGIDFKQIQLIFIDQEDNRDVFNDLNHDIEFTYLKTNHCSLSHARNIGLPYVKGKYIGFPDDDCWYEPDTLLKVIATLTDSRYQGVTGKGTNERGELTSVFPKNSAVLTKTNRCAAISYTVFFEFQPELKFNELIGVGSKYNIGAGEETDYLLTLIEQYAYKIFYDPTISIHHPTSDIYDNDVLLRRSYSYARGAGYITKKHKFSIQYTLRQFMRPLGGIFWKLLKLDFNGSYNSFFILKGRLEGYFFKTKE